MYSCWAGLHRFLSLLVALAEEEASQESLMNEQRVDTEQRVGTGRVAARISDAAVHVLSDYTGRGPTEAKTTIGEDLVTIVLGHTLTKGERKLVGGGNVDRVLQLRHDYQRMMRDDLVKIVEDLADRKVVAFMSANHIEPHLAVEVFVLRPQEDGAGAASPG